MTTTAQISTLSINPKDERATNGMNPAFVAKIERSKNSKTHFVEWSKLWN